jgi:hypothetical protein
LIEYDNTLLTLLYHVNAVKMSSTEQVLQINTAAGKSLAGMPLDESV